MKTVITNKKILTVIVIFCFAILSILTFTTFYFAKAAPCPSGGDPSCNDHEISTICKVSGSQGTCVPSGPGKTCVCESAASSSIVEPGSSVSLTGAFTKGGAGVSNALTQACLALVNLPTTCIDGTQQQTSTDDLGNYLYNYQIPQTITFGGKAYLLPAGDYIVLVQAIVNGLVVALQQEQLSITGTGEQSSIQAQPAPASVISANVSITPVATTPFLSPGNILNQLQKLFVPQPTQQPNTITVTGDLQLNNNPQLTPKPTPSGCTQNNGTVYCTLQLQPTPGSAPENLTP